MSISPLEVQTIEDGYDLSPTGAGGSSSYGHGSNLENIASMAKEVSDELGWMFKRLNNL